MKILKPFALFICAACAFFPAAVPALEAAPVRVAKKAPAATKENWQELFADGLFSADGKPVPLSALTSKKFIGVYSSASWCGPCKAFTPELIAFYKKNKGKIEIVLLGADRDQEAVFKYMKDHGMTWLAAKRGSGVIQRFSIRHDIKGIPDFRVFKKNGELLVADGRNLAAVRAAIGGK